MIEEGFATKERFLTLGFDRRNGNLPDIEA